MHSRFQQVLLYCNLFHVWQKDWALIKMSYCLSPPTCVVFKDRGDHATFKGLADYDVRKLIFCTDSIIVNRHFGIVWVQEGKIVLSGKLMENMSLLARTSL